MQKITVAKARNGLYKLIDDIAKNNKPISITSKNHNAILISEKGWDLIMKKIWWENIVKKNKIIG